MLGEYSKALQASERAIELQEDDGYAYCNKANALSGLGRYDEAVLAAEKALAISPGLTEAEESKAFALSMLVTQFPECTKKPADPDHDVLYEDLNGNGRKDFNDVVVFFKNMEWIDQKEPISCFDVNGNKRIDFNDVVRLFKEI